MDKQEFNKNLNKIYLDLDLFLSTEKHNCLIEKKPHYNNKFERLNQAHKYVKHLFTVDKEKLFNNAVEKFKLPRTRKYTVLIDVPISYEFKFPIVIKIDINRKFEFKYSLVQKGSSKRDNLYKYRSFQDPNEVFI